MVVARGSADRGEPGIGKSTLLLAAKTSAEEAGVRVLTARARPADSSIPFCGVADLLSQVNLDSVAGIPADEWAPLDRIARRSVPIPANLTAMWQTRFWPRYDTLRCDHQCCSPSTTWTRSTAPAAMCFASSQADCRNRSHWWSQLCHHNPAGPALLPGCSRPSASNCDE